MQIFGDGFISASGYYYPEQDKRFVRKCKGQTDGVPTTPPLRIAKQREIGFAKFRVAVNGGAAEAGKNGGKNF